MTAFLLGVISGLYLALAVWWAHGMFVDRRGGGAGGPGHDGSHGEGRRRDLAGPPAPPARRNVSPSG